MQTSGQRPAPAEGLPAPKQVAMQAVERVRDGLVDLSHRIHERPELAFEERFASSSVADFLKSCGFQVEFPYRDLETSFRAEMGEGEPCVAIIAEYDALPGLGHACGHNIIATAAAGAGAAVAQALRSAAVPGRVAVIGT